MEHFNISERSCWLWRQWWWYSWLLTRDMAKPGFNRWYPVWLAWDWESWSTILYFDPKSSALGQNHKLSFGDDWWAQLLGYYHNISVWVQLSPSSPRSLWKSDYKVKEGDGEVFVILSLCVKVAIWKELRKGICYNIWLITIKQCESFELRQLNKCAVNSSHAIRMINGFSK